MQKIHFFIDGVLYLLPGKTKISKWLSDLVLEEGKILGEVNIIITSDTSLLELNKRFLDHDFYTDILTFQDEFDKVSGEIYISLERVIQNAKSQDVDFETELFRVMAHGILHMCGYSDKGKEEKRIMRAREDFYLTLRNF